ncbi:hypothetical protein H6F90_29830 [Trichocoleus sp. FACHB-591]|uniref:hypothetical protein n=1 Tax=Trichocoleus sp. FACHB-591 TaxID=2692872 RepID=UPI0016865223|nr:hypothetical protein [Trichocoleus sp. FACHB-591]MBD2099267.1 hypothetical protein [Trichocoleus sp. FACHB-591]
MTQLRRRLFFIAPRLLIALPVCLIAYAYLLWYAVPRLLKSGNTIQTYIGFYIQHPSILGQASNLRCVTDGGLDAIDRYEYHCRFNVKPFSVRLLVWADGLKFGRLTYASENECDPSDIVDPMHFEYSPSWHWWKPGELEVDSGAQCYSSSTDELAYSPASQTAYMRNSYDF